MQNVSVEITKLILENRMRMREKKITVNSESSTGVFGGTRKLGRKEPIRRVRSFISKI